ncbi:MAG: ATP-dependent DNA helicase, partial [Candidatus Bathyarchaeia archaeon]
KEVNCIFDEAHSLPYYAAGILSDELSTLSLRRALKEAERHAVEDSGLLEALYNVVRELGMRAYKKFGFDVEHVIDKEEIVNSLMRKLKLTADRLLDIVSSLSEEGERIRQRRVEEGKSPVSYLSRCARFLESWISVVGSSYVHYVKAVVGREERRYAKIGLKCLDPALAAGVINKLRSAILMSGTLWHADYYTDVLGIQRSRCETIELPSPFPPENRLILIDKSVTTKFEKRGEQQWRKIADHLQRIIEAISGRIAVYFPSYEVMQAILENVKFDRNLLVEKRDTRIVDVLEFLKSNEKCVVFGVVRGKISEGVDMSTEGRSMLSAIVIVGLPYPKRTEIQNALLNYFKSKFGSQAIVYANDIPCLNAMAQSAGRLLRSPQDRGIIIIMDGRATGRFKQKLPKEWKEEMKAHLKIEKLIGGIHGFFTQQIEGNLTPDGYYIS